jgi:NAD(P)-dependent dehydrogenase (short-subunit alcohol dehydrogenase family)
LRAATISGAIVRLVTDRVNLQPRIVLCRRMLLTGRAAIVTGASRGLGQAIAARFISEGADVMLVARGEPTLRQAADGLLASRPSDTQQVLYRTADVSRSDEVDRVVGDTLSALGRVDVLVCNAGVQGPIGRLDDLAWEDWVRAIEINLFGAVLFCRAVLPTMRRQGHGKIILLSGGGATRARPRFTAYAAAKTAVVRFGETLAEELQDTGIDVNSVAPGTLDTGLLDEVLKAGPERAGRAEFDNVVRRQDAPDTTVPLEVPARLVTFLASAASDGISGRLLSAVWDAWADLPAARERLAGSDVFKLRRVEPADRGWDVA